MVIKTDYMDVLLGNVESEFARYVRDIEEMSEAEKNGEEAFIKTYIRLIAHAVHNYYDLADVTIRESFKQVGVKKRHVTAWDRVCELDRKLDRLAREHGFEMGMFDARRGK